MINLMKESIMTSWQNGSQIASLLNLVGLMAGLINLSIVVIAFGWELASS